MAIGVPTNIGTSFNGAVSTSVQQTTTAAIASADIVCVIWASSPTMSAPSVTDDSTNSYTVHGPYAIGPSSSGLWWAAICENATAMASGGKITISYTGSSRSTIDCFTISGGATSGALLDFATTPGANGALFSVNTGVSVPVGDISIGMFFTNGSPSSTVSPGTGFTAMTGSDSGGNYYDRAAYQITVGAGVVTYNPQWTTTRDYGGGVMTFSAASAGAAASGATALLMGV